MLSLNNSSASVSQTLPDFKYSVPTLNFNYLDGKNLNSVQIFELDSKLDELFKEKECNTIEGTWSHEEIHRLVQLGQHDAAEINRQKLLENPKRRIDEISNEEFIYRRSLREAKMEYVDNIETPESKTGSARRFKRKEKKRILQSRPVLPPPPPRAEYVWENSNSSGYDSDYDTVLDWNLPVDYGLDKLPTMSRKNWSEEMDSYKKKEFRYDEDEEDSEEEFRFVQKKDSRNIRENKKTGRRSDKRVVEKNKKPRQVTNDEETVVSRFRK
jgi:hypothetical protein